MAALEKVLAQELSSETSYSLTGQSLDFMESQSSATFVFGLALVVVFLVLAAQFESFRDPFVVLLTVPLAVAGALGALLLSGHTSNVYSMIGIITLVGLITKHGIMICAFANQLQEQDGLDKREAVLQAAEMRLRPILMTSGAMILGVLPLALASGPGAMGRQAIGVSVVGGLAVGTLLTLFVIPSVYSYLARERNKA
ncbi:MAG: efflux RND transporter permease subunit [Rhodospirillaceae bacterium]|nr:efflux RND transporter permease subunit [Rhodospirillaceae bacterium]